MFDDVATRYHQKYIKPIEDGWLKRFESKFRRRAKSPSSEPPPSIDAPTAYAASTVITRPLPQGVLIPAEVDRICLEEKRTQFLIEGLLPAAGIAIAAGESSIGKSALICQLGLCVAAGVPFLGMKTVPGRVLYFDLENSIFDCKAMRDSLVGFLRLDRTPKDFLLMQEPMRENAVEDVTNKKPCPECSLRLYLAKRVQTLGDSMWLCANEKCPSNRRKRTHTLQMIFLSPLTKGKIVKRR